MDDNAKAEIIDGRFRLDSERIAGGMGVVHRAFDLKTNQPVALKISTSFGTLLGERFEQEATCLAQIAHPAIVRYIAHGKTKDREHYLAMEWLEGETLEECLSRGALTLADGFRVARRIAEALNAIHARGIIHRDIKPANIFLPGKDLTKLKLLDFGIARRLFDAGTMRLTQVGSTLGTPMYMSPEQAQGLPDVDGRADVFSLGCVIFECLMGNPPFMGDSSTATLLEVESGHAFQSAGRLRTVSPALGELVERMLARDRADRPATMAEVIASLDGITQELRTTGTLPAVPESASGRSSLAAAAERRLAVVLTVFPGGANARTTPVSAAGGTSDVAGLLARGFAGGPMGDVECAAINPRLGTLGVNLRRRPEGGYVALFVPERTTPAPDLIAQAALVALRLKSVQPAWVYALAMGQVARDDAASVEALCQTGLSLVTSSRPGAVCFAPDLRRMVEARFEVAADPAGRYRVLFEKTLQDAPPTVLGRDVPCVGRDRDIDALEGLYLECVDEGSPRVQVLVGGAGAGKSRVAREFLHRIQQRGEPFGLLVGRGDPMRMDVSLGLVGQALRAAAGIVAGMPEVVQRKRLHAHATRHAPADEAELYAAFLGEIAGVPFPDDHLPPLREARRDPRQMADQTRHYWLEWLKAETVHAPLVILFEDLHWGDVLSVGFVDEALRKLKDRSVFALAIGRPELDFRFPHLWKDQSPQRSTLSPLGERAMGEIIRAVLGDVSDDKRQGLLDRAQGNPFFLEELLRSFVARGTLVDIPDTLLGMVHARFEAVGEACKGILRAGSVFGQVFQAAGVRYMLPDVDPDDVDRWLEILASKEILYGRVPGSNAEYGFRHSLHRDAAYALLGPELEVLGHRLAGEFLEGQPNPEAIVVADHFELGQDNQRAVVWLRLAANQALEVDDLPAALERVEKGVRLGAEGDDLAGLCLVESEIRMWQGEFGKAEQLAREARKSTNPGVRLRALYSLISSIGPQAKYEEIREHLDAIAHRPSDPSLHEAWYLCTFGATAFLAASGEYDLARATLFMLEPDADSLSPYLAGRLNLLRANVARMDGRLVESVRCFRRASALFEEIGNMREATLSLGLLGNSLAEVGQLADAESTLRTVLQVAIKRNLNYLLGGCYQMLCSILAFQGRLDEARAAGQSGVAISEKHADHVFQGSSYCYLSVTEYLALDFGKAEHYARLATQLLATSSSLQPFAHALVARAQLAQQRVEEGGKLAEEAFNRLSALGALDDGEGYVRLAFAEALLSRRDFDRLRYVLRDAVGKIREKLQAIEEKGWRKDFLYNLPENRRLVELAKAQQIETGFDLPVP